MIHLTASGVYPWLRLLLGLVCLPLAWRLRHHIAIACYFLIDAVEHLMPARLYSASWWRAINLPVRSLQFLAALVATGWILRETGKPLTCMNREYLRWSSCFIGSAIALIGWYWVPVESFHAADAARQFGYLGMLVSFALSLAWLYLECNIQPERPLVRLGSAWVVWLAFQFLGCTTGAGNLLWDIVPWQGGSVYYFAVSDISLLGQIVTAVWLARYQMPATLSRCPPISSTAT